jgi:hypothetical protein
MESDRDDSGAPRSWGQRHGLTIMMVVMAVMFAVVIIVQMKT